VKFLRIISTEAKAGYDDIALPTLILYKEGKTLQTYVRVTDDLGSEFTAVDVQELLSLHGVLPWNDNIDSLNIRKKPTF
jgi:hypothetical protein